MDIEITTVITLPASTVSRLRELSEIESEQPLTSGQELEMDEIETEIMDELRRQSLITLVLDGQVAE